jgi:pentatricopeptide repeat protein
MGHIDDEIKQKQKELAELMELKAKQSIVMELNEYTDAEKIECFDKIHEFAYNIISKIRNGDYHEDNDDEHYAFEAVMNVLAREGDTDKFWDYYNELIEKTYD